MILPNHFYCREDVLAISQELIGKFLCSHIDGVVTAGMIIETEAYKGVEDRACHAFGNRRTKRTEVMFQGGGISYVYLCYGIHYLFNVVTGNQDTPHAILVRALKPTDGIATMLQRRHKQSRSNTLTNGPGTVTQALGITTAHNALSLQGPTIWIEDRHVDVLQGAIVALPRIGVEYAGDDALKPWRYIYKPSAD
jgi:DNA-3-methyladenine glycosylase